MLRPSTRRAGAVLALFMLSVVVRADNTAQTLPFSQDWANAGLITANDSWSGVPGIIGYRGDGLTTTTGANPQTITLPAIDPGDTPPGVVDVNANQSNPNTFTTGGVTEFAIANPVVALSGSGTATAPFVLLHLDTSGHSGIQVSYNLRDIDGSTDNAVQPVALQYRVGSSGSFTNIPAGFVADATTGPSLATLVTPVQATLPGACDNQALVQVRIITTNAVGNDEWVGIDDICVGTACFGAGTTTLSIDDVNIAEGDAGTTTFRFTVSLSAPAPAGGVTFDVATADSTATTAGNDYLANSLTGQSIPEGSATYKFDVAVNGDTATEPDETFLVNISNVVGATVADGQGRGTIANDDVSLTPIASIQGPGASSPLVGASVTTRGVVTGAKTNGFFIQEPDASADAAPATSEGVFVFTSAAPPAAAAVGNLVQVTGTVAEFVPSGDVLQPPLTELTSPSVTLISTGQPLPAAVPLGAGFPDPAGPVDQLERLEGMRVQVSSLTVTGPTLGNINEAAAAATTSGVFHGVVTGVARPFREPGIPANDPPPSGTIPPIPRFDANPELIRVDSDGQPGAVAIDVGAGAVVTGLVGPLDYAFRAYTILPDPGTPPGVTGGPTPAAVTSPTALEVTVASFNLQRFFDTVDDPAIGEPVLSAAAFDARLKKASRAVRDYLGMPDILGVQEVENVTTLQALAARIGTDALAATQPDPRYAAYLVEGNDVGGIDVGFLVKTAVVAGATPRVTVSAVVQERDGTLFVNPDASTELLNDRPPLRLNAVVHQASGASFPLTVIVNHLRSLSGANDTSAGANGWATVGDRVRAKRLQQAEDLASLVQARQAADPAERIVIAGDFNAFDFNDGLGDSLGVIKGTPAPDNQTAVPGDGVDLVDPDLENLGATPLPAERYSYVFDGNAQALDHVLVNQALVADTTARRLEHARIGADFPETARNDAATALRLSDHDPAVAYFSFALPADLAITKTDGQATAVPGQSLTYTVVAANAGPNAVTGASVTDSVPAVLTGVTWTCVGAGGGTCPASGSRGISETVDLPAGGSVTFSLTGMVDTAATGNLSNMATVAAPSGIIDPNPADNAATDGDSLTPQADLWIWKTDGQASAAAGTPITYTIMASNAGPSDASGARVADTVPAAILGATWTCAGAGGGICSASGTGDIDDTVDLPVGGSVTYTLTGTIDAAAVGSLVNTATVAAPPGVTDPNAGNDVATDADTLGGLVYYTVVPCRVVDTRGGAPVGGPVLHAREIRIFAIAGHCGIPADARAVSINMTVTEPTALGHVRLFPAESAYYSTVSSINYAAGQTRANNAFVTLNAVGELAAFVSQAQGTVHLIVDVNGYYR